MFVSLLIAEQSQTEIESIAKKFRKKRYDNRYAVICDLPGENPGISLFQDLCHELMKKTRVEVSYSRNLENRTSRCLVTAVLGTTTVFSDEEAKCSFCQKDAVVKCSKCGDCYCVDCSCASEDCKKCYNTKLETMLNTTEYLLSQYQICEGAKCTNIIMVEFIGENKVSISKQ